MKHKISLYLVSIILYICNPSAAADAQVSVNVPVTDELYRSIDRLMAFGLLEEYHYGLRPLSRVQIARLVVQARHRFQERRGSNDGDGTFDKVSTDIERSIVALENDLSSEILQIGEDGGGAPWELETFRNLTVIQNYLDSPSRPVPRDIRHGEIDAFINTLYAHRDGRRFVQGSNSYLQFQNWLRAFEFVSLDFTPYLYLGVPKENAKSQQKLVVERLSLKVGFRNLELQVGRDQVIWSQGQLGGVLISNNPRPFDMVKLSTFHPFLLPWFLRHLGPSSGSIFVARLGENRNFPHSDLIGFSMNTRPLPPLEVALYHTYILGGSGAPDSDIIDAIAEFFLIRRHGEAFEEPGSPNLADHRAGINARFHAASFRHTQFYFEWIWDDFPSKILHTSAFLIGVYVPRVDFSAKTSLRLEFHSLARILYRHTNFRTGYAEDKFIIGDPLGPKALAFLFRGTQEFEGNLLFDLQFVYEDHRGVNTGVVNLEGIHERRFRTIATLQSRIAFGLSAKGTAGHEHVWNFDFEPGNERDNFLFELAVEFPF